ncbi:hypothetical protein LNQ82_06695 [Conchiformibius steedae DSM 2580]|uniref:Uncharacterized protein n=1 Tax=Conchiformibius steedae DSM 2580 TaxID=1121352 RepID=A0AAE9HUH7_9NEIS|nr:hypothetical protein [Conchiformibius steedae]QMT34130.1 hypothetical protein H3L98_03775 [Conchiformibius steedae]URD66903.1 hypothetical protein LNQ82_06695 [Conchiformibius steedae DSM 2580]
MIDGIVSGKLLLKPKPMYTIRGTEYMIAKMNVYGYPVGNLKADDLDGDIIAFDKNVCAELKRYKQGDVISILGIITPIYEPKAAQPVPITLKITARRLYVGYLDFQAHGKGLIFEQLGCR